MQSVLTYSPQVNDYVIWNKGSHSVEGWVYFKCPDYITIETKVWPKPVEDQSIGTFHRNERVLVICYVQSWNELTYIQSRPSIDSPEQEYYVKELSNLP
jgi:hypothetical protein